MELLVVVVAVIAVAATASDSEWIVYKAKHGKQYEDGVDNIRRSIWEENLQTIKSHNELYAKGLKSFYLGENEYADMTNAEFVKMMNGLTLPSTLRAERFILREATSYSEGSHANTSLPKTVDWTKKGYVTPVKNQQSCGSCWAFSATGAMEGAHFKKTGKLVSLSEKNLMDCSSSYGNKGCKGGNQVLAYRYVIANRGIDTEASYPYVPKTGPCRFRRSNVGTKIKSYEVVPQSEKALRQVTAQIGPIAVGIDASHENFRLYRGGVYDEPMCSSSRLDHGVLVVGYGTSRGRDYWLVKNSWGRMWGLNGYIRMSRNKNNQCGIATMASYPIV